MNVEQPAPQPVVVHPPDFAPPPWSVRESWYGVILALVVAFAGTYVMAALGSPALLRASALTIVELLFLVPVAVILLRHRAGWQTLGFRAFEPRMMAMGCGLLVGIYIVTFCQNVVMLLLHVELQSESVAGLLTSGQSQIDLALSTIVAAPFAEEILFRGFLFQGFRNGYGWKKAALISSLIFAVMHFQLSVFIPTLLLGLLFATLYNRSNSIWPGIILHLFMNLIAVGMWLLMFQTSSLPQFTP